MEQLQVDFHNAIAARHFEYISRKVPKFSTAANLMSQCVEKKTVDELVKKTPLWEKAGLEIVVSKEVYNSMCIESRTSLAENKERFSITQGTYFPAKGYVYIDRIENHDVLEKKFGPFERSENHVSKSTVNKYLCSLAERPKTKNTAVAEMHTHINMPSALPSALDVMSIRTYLNVLGIVTVAVGQKVEMAGYTPYSKYDLFSGGVKERIHIAEGNGLLPVKLDSF